MANSARPLRADQEHRVHDGPGNNTQHTDSAPLSMVATCPSVMGQSSAVMRSHAVTLRWLQASFGIRSRLRYGRRRGFRS